MHLEIAALGSVYAIPRSFRKRAWERERNALAHQLVHEYSKRDHNRIAIRSGRLAVHPCSRSYHCNHSAFLAPSANLLIDTICATNEHERRVASLLNERIEPAPNVWVITVMRTRYQDNVGIDFLAHNIKSLDRPSTLSFERCSHSNSFLCPRSTL